MKKIVAFCTGSRFPEELLSSYFLVIPVELLSSYLLMISIVVIDFLSFWVPKVLNGTWRFTSVIKNFSSLVELVIVHSLMVKFSILQLIKVISRVLQKVF